MIPMPSISVVMAVYNDERYVSMAIESILQQTHSQFEFIIVNDGSTDGTLGILEQYAALDSRIQIVNQSNEGLVGALNNGIRHAHGEIIARMDGDDISMPRRLETLVRPFQQDPAVVLAGGNAELIDEMGETTGYRVINCADANQSITRRMIFQHGDILFRKTAYEKVGGYRKGFRYSQDYDLVLRMSDGGTLVKEPSITYRLRISADTPSFAKRYQQSRLAQYAKGFYFERKKNGKDSYEESTALLQRVANDPRRDLDFGKYWLAMVKYRDFGKRKAARDLVDIITNGAVLKWRMFSLVVLVLPERMVRYLLTFREHT
jgi:glycosyltransferase involved in cell wall biosynthesis